MTSPSPTRGLGGYMRTIGKNLRTLRPMTVNEAHDLIKYADEGYAAATLIRLRERGIAAQIWNGGFIQGPNWLEAAAYYDWPRKEKV